MKRNIREWLNTLSLLSRVAEHTKDPEERESALQVCDLSTFMLKKAGYPVEQGDNGEILIQEGSVSYRSRLSAEGMENLLRDAIAEKEVLTEYGEDENIENIENILRTDAVPESLEERQEESTEDKTEEFTKKTGTEPQAEEKPEKERETVLFADRYGTSYPDHISSKDLSLSYIQIKVSGPDHKTEEQAEMLITPLCMDEGESDIMVWLTDNRNTDVRVSRDGRPSVPVKLGKWEFIAAGRVTPDGRFIGSVKLADALAKEGYTLESRSAVRGDRGHIRLYDEGIEIRLSPLSTRNRPDGNAEFCYLIVQDGKEILIGDNSSGDRVLFEYDDSTMELIARWKDDVLYAKVNPR